MNTEQAKHLAVTFQAVALAELGYFGIAPYQKPIGAFLRGPCLCFSGWSLALSGRFRGAG